MNKQFTSQFSMQLLARQMAVAGYVTRITRIHTGLSYKQILKIYSDLEDEGVRCEKRARIPKTGTSLIRNVTSLIQGSLLMQFYYSLAGDEIYKSVDLNLLNQAFQLYLSIREEFGYITDPRWNPFNISDAWCLANELRSAQAYLEYCPSCQCNYLSSQNQRTYIDCPFCVPLQNARFSQKSEDEASCPTA